MAHPSQYHPIAIFCHAETSGQRLNITKVSLIGHGSIDMVLRTEQGDQRDQLSNKRSTMATGSAIPHPFDLKTPCRLKPWAFFTSQLARIEWLFNEFPK